MAVAEHQVPLHEPENELIEHLGDRRRIIGDGAARLLIELVRRGLDEQCLVPAALLALELEEITVERRRKSG